jgi:hypothetical protein
MAIEAEVSGSEDYQVRIDLNIDGEVDDYFCSCPAYEKYDGACKHIVAVLLETLKQNNLENLPTASENPQLSDKKALRIVHSTPPREDPRLSLSGGHRILLFSQFVSMLAIIEDQLLQDKVRHFRLDGQTPPENRLQLVNAFNKGDTQVFLISLKAGGTGLNLTGADTVIHYEPWWNLRWRSKPLTGLTGSARKMPSRYLNSSRMALLRKKSTRCNKKRRNSSMQSSSLVKTSWVK